MSYDAQHTISLQLHCITLCKVLQNQHPVSQLASVCDLCLPSTSSMFFQFFIMQIEGLVGAKEVLKTVPEKSSFLQSLHAKDCLRLLGMVCSPWVYLSCSSIPHSFLAASCYCVPCVCLWHGMLVAIRQLYLHSFAW